MWFDPEKSDQIICVNAQSPKDMPILVVFHLNNVFFSPEIPLVTYFAQH